MRLQLSKEVILSITSLIPYGPAFMNRPITEGNEGALTELIEKNGQEEPIIVSSQPKSSGEYQIYAGHRRYNSHLVLNKKYAKQGIIKFETIRAFHLLNDDNKRAVHSALFGKNGGAGREPFQLEDEMKHLIKTYPKEMFLEEHKGGLNYSKKSGSQIVPLSRLLVEDWSMSYPTARRRINQVIEYAGWKNSTKKPKRYPELDEANFKFALKKAKTFNKLFEQINILSEQKKAIQSEVISEFRLMNSSEWNNFLEDVEKGKFD